MNARILHAGASIVAGCFVMALTASAHDTNTTHPQMTNAAGLAIENADRAAVVGAFSGAYSSCITKSGVREGWGENAVDRERGEVLSGSAPRRV